MQRDRALIERLSPESQLLLLAAGPPSADAEIESLLRRQPIDWPIMLAMADRERATAILWRRARAHVPSSVGPELREPFERMAMIADFTAGYLEQRIGESMAHLNARGMQGLLLKGAALAASVYESWADRPMGDIDVVVERPRADEAFDALQGAGWRWNADAYPRERYVGHHHFPPLLDAKGMDVRLELHTDLFVDGSPFGLDVAHVLRDGREVQVGKGTAIIPSPEHLLLHTCVHYTWSHMMLFGAWRAFRDVMALMNAGLDWDKVLREAKTFRAESACFWTLRLAQRLAGATLPSGVMQELSKAASPRWIAVCERHAAREMFESPDRCPSQWMRRTLWEVSLRPGASGHGAARPWLLDDFAPENVDPEARAAGVTRAFRQLPRIGAWIRYVRVLLG